MSGDRCGSTDTSSGDPCRWHETDRGPCPFHDDTQETPKPGRPSKLSYERQENIAALIEEGRSINSAARINEITPQTVYNWLDRGQAEYKDGNENAYTEFFERITRAKGYGEEWYFQTIMDIAREEGDHRFLASLMKQRYPDSWGDTDTGVDAETTVIQLPDSVTQEWQRQPNTQ